MPVEWDTLVLEARRKAREVNPRACLLTDADIVIAMADEIDRLRAANVKFVDACENLIIAYAIVEHESQRPDWLKEMVKPIRAALAAAEASASPPPPIPGDLPGPPPTADTPAPHTPARPPRA